MSVAVEIPGYRVTEEIGRGGMARVFCGVQLALDRPVAIKILTSDSASVPDFSARFLHEARLLARLTHPNILSVYDVGVHDDVHYMVTEYLPGGSLRARVAQGIEVGQALAIAHAVATALSVAHGHNIVHRDIKPSNVLFRTDGTPVLADFGIANLIAGDRGEQRTQVGMVLGTPGYMSPEQMTGARVDRSADIYALGVVLYEMLTGELPYRGDEPLAVALQTVNDPIPRLPPHLAPLQPLIERLLAKSPAERMSDAGLVATELAALARQGFSEAPVHRASCADPRTLHPANTEPAATTARSEGWFGWLCALVARLTDDHSDRGIPEAAPATRPPTPPREYHARPKPEPESVTMIVPANGSLELLAREAGSQAENFPPDATRLVQARGAAPEGIPVALMIAECGDPGEKGRRTEIDHFPFSVGRSTSADLPLPGDFLLSRRHLEISRGDHAFYICDLSRNGIFVNGRRLRSNTREPLLFGDSIVLSPATTVTFVANVEPLPDLTGTLIDNRYRLEECMHASIKASTFSARDEQLPRLLAIKLFSPSLARISHYRDAFRQQAEIAAQLTHPHIARVLDSSATMLDLGGEKAQVQYLCMERMTGGNLAEKLRTDQPPDLAAVLKWLTQLADALSYAHDKGIVHTALKPSAIVFDDEDHLYLSDFALASVEGTATGSAVLGAPAFIAPEQWDNERVTRAVDQYALAVLVYLMVSGSHPFEGQGDPEVRRRNFSRPPLPVHQEAARNGRQDVPPALSAVLAKGLATRPVDRHESVQAFVDALTAAASGKRRGDEARVFISYHRESSAGWALLFERELAAKHAFKPYLDTQAVDRAARFPNRLAKAIADSDVFVCLLGKGTLDSPWVQEEIRIAAEHAKPMVPVFQESFIHPGNEDELAPHLRSLLSFDGVHLLDQRNIHIDHSITDLARIIQQTTSVD